MINLNESDYNEEIIDIFTSNYNNEKIPVNCIPNKSGIYIFFDSHKKEILYIGKAKLLRSRLVSYKKNTKTIEILKYIYGKHLTDEIHFGFEVYVFLNETPESLEKTLIEYYNPKFNIHFTNKIYKKKD